MGIFDKADQRTVSASETTIIASGAKIEGIFKALARALKMAKKRDIFNYELPSTKGVI